jgi:Flp pilus assembly protein TadD
LLHLKLGNNAKAFEFLGNSLTYDPKNAKTILAAGSIIQDNQDMDVALVKYRVAATQTPNSAQLWNNIGTLSPTPGTWHRAPGTGHLGEGGNDSPPPLCSEGSPYLITSFPSLPH